MWTQSECQLLAELAQVLEAGFSQLPDFPAEDPGADMRRVLFETATRLRDNFPYHHPLYVGQMLKPPHAVARLAYALSLALNPNNHALDGGRASSRMEQECVAGIARMFGWERVLGHLCGGGTMANLEALWIARELRPGQAVAASAQAHYTHARLSGVLGVPFVSLPVDPRGRIDLQCLETELRTGRIGTVVATAGTTAAGAVDPVPEILALRRRFDFRLHVDAAYGGYYILAANLLPETRRIFDSLTYADSLVLDPHKHGLQPYGCGCVLFRDPAVGRFYRHDSPYTYFSSPDLHLGEISLECSRPGAAAVALWATMQILPLEAGGEFARGLESGRQAALQLLQCLLGSSELVPLFPPELDIVVWAVRAASCSESSARARRLFESAAIRNLHLALATFPRAMAEAASPVVHWDQDQIVCLRACVMKPAHAAWLHGIVSRLQDGTCWPGASADR